MVGTAIAAGLSAAATLGTTIYGAIKSKEYNDASRKLIQDQRDENKRWYETKMSQDYTMRTDAQNVLKRQRELLDERYKQAAATNVVAGGTDEQLAMQKQAANEAMAQTMGDIAADASKYKDNVEQAYRSADAALNQQQAQGLAAQGAGVAQAAGQATSAGLNLTGNLLQADNYIKKEKSDNYIKKEKS